MEVIVFNSCLSCLFALVQMAVFRQLKYKQPILSKHQYQLSTGASLVGEKEKKNIVIQTFKLFICFIPFSVGVWECAIVVVM